MERIYKGTEIKVAVHLSIPPGLDIDDIDFTCTFYTGSPMEGEVKHKRDLQYENGVYIAALDTRAFGIGELKCRVDANIPDSQFLDGYRKEVVFSSCGLIILRGL